MARTPTGIPTDPPLVSKGVEQSKELAEYLAKIEPPVDRIYSSPFYRCLQTLKPFSDKFFEDGKGKGKIRIDRGIGYVLVEDVGANHEQPEELTRSFTANSSDAPISNIPHHHILNS